MIAYAITNPSTLNFQRLGFDLECFSKKADMILYRDKDNTDYATCANNFLHEAKKFSFDKILLHADYRLAMKLGADGVHLTSSQFHDIAVAKELGLFVIISTHTFDEVEKAESLGADMVTFSPIFSTPNKGKPKGVELLNSLVSQYTIPIIALGGIVTTEHIALCEKSGAKGFASIRYFSKKDK